MNNPPFEIEIKNKRTFMLIAFLVDRDDFISDVLLIRKKLDVKFINNREKSELSLMTNFQKKRLEKLTPTERERQEYFDKMSIRETGNEIVDYDIKFLLKKYKKGFAYYYVVKNSIIYGHIKNFDFSTTLPYISAANYKLPENIIPYNYPQIAIIVDPDTNIDIIPAEIRKFIKYQKKSGVDYGWISPDVISNIRRDRKWYWLSKKKGMSKLFKQTKNYDQKTIEKAVYQYKRNISKLLTENKTLPLMTI